MRRDLCRNYTNIASLGSCFFLSCKLQEKQMMRHDEERSMWPVLERRQRLYYSRHGLVRLMFESSPGRRTGRTICPRAPCFFFVFAFFWILFTPHFSNMKILALFFVTTATAFTTTRPVVGRPTFVVLQSTTRPDASSAVQAALEASEKYGPTSPEARVAWDAVEEMDASDNT